MSEQHGLVLQEGGEVVFNIEDALNQPGFAEFLASYPDAESVAPDNNEIIQRRFEDFKAKDAVIAGVQNVFKGELKSLDTGVDFGDDFDSAIKERIDSLVFESEGSVTEIANVVDEYKALPGQIAEAEGRLKQLIEKGDLVGSIEQLEEKISILEVAQETTGFLKNIQFRWRYIGEFVRTHATNTKDRIQEIKSLEHIIDNPDDYNPAIVEKAQTKLDELEAVARQAQARSIVKDEFGIKLDPEVIVFEIEKTKAEIEALSKKKEQFDQLQKVVSDGREKLTEMKSFITQSVFLDKRLSEKAKQKVVETLENLMVKNPDKAQDVLERVKAVPEEGLLQLSLEEGDLEQLQLKVDRAVHEWVSAAIYKAAESTPLAGKVYDNLYRALKVHLERRKIGSRENEGATRTIVSMLEDIARKFQSEKKDKARAFLLRTIALKLARI